jgi:hypothetical protein
MRRLQWLILFLIPGLLAVTAGVAAAQDKAVRLPFTDKHIQDSLRTDWYGVYLKEKKIGYARTTFEKAQRDGAMVYRNSMRLVIKAQSAGVPFEMTTVETEEFDGQAPYNLRWAQSIQQQDQSKQKVTLVRSPQGGFTATTTANGTKTTKKLAAFEYALADIMTSYVWILRHPRVGETITTRSFDFDKLRIEPEHHKVLAAKESLVKGVKVTYYEVESLVPSQGSPMLIRFDADGNMISGQFAGVFEMRLETEKEAKNLHHGTDLFVMGLVKIDKGLGEPGNVAGMVVELEGKEAGLLKNGPRQQVTKTPDGKYVCKIGRKYANDIKATDKEITESLQDTTSYPSAHPRIVELAKMAVGDAKTPREKVERLIHFVHKYIQPSYRGKGLVVLDLLDSKKGDCTAYAALFTTLARAAGIPAREVSGFAYMGDSQKSFGGHAWNEVVLDGRWHPIDASVGEFEVDGARLYLGSDVQGGTSLLRTYGGLSLRLIEVEHRTPAGAPPAAQPKVTPDERSRG